MNSNKPWSEITGWVEKHSRTFIIVGVIVAGVSNQVHNDLEEENTRKSDLVNALDQYHRLESLYRLTSEEDRTIVYTINAQPGTYSERAIRSLPTVERNHRETLAMLDGLLDLTQHVRGMEADARRIDYISGVGARLEPTYQAITTRLNGNFANPPKFAKKEDADAVGFLVSEYYKQHYNVASEAKRLESRVLAEATKQNSEETTASKRKLTLWRCLTWVGLCLPLVSAIKPSKEVSDKAKK